MPHIIIKMYSGRSDDQKIKLAEEVAKAVMNVTGNGEQSISVAVEDIRPEDWTEKVYKPDILGHWEELYKKPGYNPLK